MEKMKFEEFTNEVVEKIKEWLPDNYCDAEIHVKSIKKNNDLTLTGLTIMCRECNVAPTIYLEQFYDSYQDGMDMPAILRRIAELRVENNVTENFDTNEITDLEKCRDKILPRLIGAKRNENMLEELPHVMLEDLAVIFCINLDNSENTEATIKVTNALRVLWKLSTEELYDIAIKNLTEWHNGKLTSLAEVIYNMAKENDIYEEECMLSKDDMFYVLSNNYNVNGAAEILDDEIMKQATEILGEEFYVLPSSIHELLLVPMTDKIEPSFLRAMVCQVNESTVQPEEQLSDNVYIYSVEKGLKLA